MAKTRGVLEQDREEIKEIKEEYNEEKEKQWRGK